MEKKKSETLDPPLPLKNKTTKTLYTKYMNKMSRTQRTLFELHTVNQLESVWYRQKNEQFKNVTYIQVCSLLDILHVLEIFCEICIFWLKSTCFDQNRASSAKNRNFWQKSAKIHAFGL